MQLLHIHHGLCPLVEYAFVEQQGDQRIPPGVMVAEVEGGARRVPNRAVIQPDGTKAAAEKRYYIPVKRTVENRRVNFTNKIRLIFVHRLLAIITAFLVSGSAFGALKGRIS